MIDLWSFLNRKVKIYFNDGKTAIGNIDMVWDGEDCDDGKDSIGLSHDADYRSGEIIGIDEIEKIEII